MTCNKKHMLGRLALLLLCLLDACSAQRVLHWVIRVSSLEDTVGFTTDVLGMKVLRHEENAEPCPLTCNGIYDTPWSKTMVGYGPEDEHYALELTYNYGIYSYDAGGGLQRFVLYIDGAAAALERAKLRNLSVVGNVVDGPDGYKYELHDKAERDDVSTVEPFGDVVLKAADPSGLAKWYSDMIGMSAAPQAKDAFRVSFPSSGLPVGFVIEPTADGAPPKIEQWEGRNAIALSETKLRAVNDRLVKESPDLIIHSMRELHEKLGTLFIVILRDPAGYEVCLVSIETFDPSVREATNYVGPDWAVRNETRNRVAGLAALDAARKKMLEDYMRAQGGEGGGDDDEDEDEEEDGEFDEDEDNFEEVDEADEPPSAAKSEL
jgi:catechol 2,3-dioxygenase-like lactoylglutathione lyase family enzyme